MRLGRRGEIVTWRVSIPHQYRFVKAHPRLATLRIYQGLYGPRVLRGRRHHGLYQLMTGSNWCPGVIVERSGLPDASQRLNVKDYEHYGILLL